MENNAVKVLFKSIMKNQEVEMNRDLEVINLLYPVTMEELSVPVRNKGCNEARVCVWPLGSLMQEVAMEVSKGNLRETLNEDFTNSSFVCRMCLEETKFAKRNYQDFYYDRKLDYLIRAAKVKYIQSFKDTFDFDKDIKAKDRVEKNFKHSKLYIHKGGGVILEYKKKIIDGAKVTYRTVVFEDTLSCYSQQLVFNPKDYARNLSALKIAQNLVQRRLGDCIDKGFQEITASYSKKYQEHLQRILCNWIIDYIIDHTQPTKKQELYAAKMVSNQSIQNRKNFELILFYPRYNLTQIYTFDEREDIITSCSKQTMKICKLANHQLLLYTSDYTYILQLEEAKASLKKNQNFTFKRPILIKQQKNYLLLEEKSVQVKYLKQWECFHKCPEKYVRLDSIRPLIESPILLTNPSNLEEVFIFGGTVQGISNTFIYKLKEGRWVRQEQQLKCNSNNFQLIVEGNRIFLLMLEEKGKQSGNKLIINELEVIEGQLLLKQSYDLNRQIKSNYLYPLRAKDHEYILADLTSKQPPIYLDLNKCIIVERTIKEDISKFIKELYDTRNQKSIFHSYPMCSITHNQLNYNILSYSMAKHTFKIMYGCDDEWMISDLSQALLHD